MRGIDMSANRWLATAVTALLMFMMLAVTADVLGRYFFSKPIQGVTELSANGVVLVIFGSFTFYHITRGHIRMTFVYDRMSDNVKKWSDLGVVIIEVLLFGIWTWAFGRAAIEAWIMNDATTAGITIPMWIPKSFMCLGSLLFFLHSFGALIVKLTPKRFGGVL